MNERKYCVYMHKNRVNDKIYVGATCMKPKQRWANGKGYKGNREFYKDILEYGWNNFEHIILEDNLNYIQSKEKEIYYINLYKDNCYNKTKGGEQGKVKHLTQKEYEQKYLDMKNNIIKYGKEHHEEMAKKSRRLYYNNEEYHQRKIEYQRRYRQEHRKTNRPYRGKFPDSIA